MELRALTLDDEDQAVAAHYELALEGFDFLLDVSAECRFVMS